MQAHRLTSLITLDGAACFAMAPFPLGFWQMCLYQWAYQCAQAVVEPSWLERDVLAVWN